MRTLIQKPKASQRTASARPRAFSRAHTGQSRGANSILHLQRTIGNQATQRLLQTDAQEPEAGLTVQASDTGQVAGPRVHEVLRSPGQPLDPETRAFMEPRFGHDFTRVKVHADSNAEHSANALNARAWTLGEHVVLGRKQDASAKHGSNWVLAHELAHVVQQEGAAKAISRSSEAGVAPANDVFEREASAAADRVTAGARASISSAQASPSIRRVETEKPKPHIPVVPCDWPPEKFAEKVAKHAAKHQINPILTNDKVTVTCRNPQKADPQPCDVVFSKLPVTVAVRWRMDNRTTVAGWDTKDGRKACRWAWKCDETGLVISPIAEECATDSSAAPPGPAPGPGGPPSPPPLKPQPGDLVASLMSGPAGGGAT
jgi:Domain of unknown function (DUF4157)